jgi:hypothetical protein
MGGGTGTGGLSNYDKIMAGSIRASELPSNEVHGINVDFRYAPQMLTGVFGDHDIQFDKPPTIGSFCADFMQTIVTIESPEHIEVWVENDELHAYSVPAQAIRAAAGVLSVYQSAQESKD